MPGYAGWRTVVDPSGQQALTKYEAGNLPQLSRPALNLRTWMFGLYRAGENGRHEPNSGLAQKGKEISWARYLLSVAVGGPRGSLSVLKMHISMWKREA